MLLGHRATASRWSGRSLNTDTQGSPGGLTRKRPREAAGERDFPGAKEISCFILFYFVFLGLLLWHMEVPRLGVESELQLPAYTTAIAMQDP